MAVQNAQLRVGNVDSFPGGSDRGMPRLVENPTARRELLLQMLIRSILAPNVANGVHSALRLPGLLSGLHLLK